MFVDALSLVALEPLPQGDWLSQADAVLRSVGIPTKRRGSQLVAWRKLRRYNSIKYSDGFLISRLWLGPGRRALSISGQRLYFCADGVEIDNRPEHLLVSGKRPQSPEASEQLNAQWALLETLAAGLGPSKVKSVTLHPIEWELAAAREVRIGSHVCSVPPESLNDVYRKVGFDTVPVNFTVSICPLEGVSSAMAEEFARRLARVAEKRHTRVRVRMSTPEEILLHLKVLQSSGRPIEQGRCVLFILPSQNQVPRNETRSLLAALEDAGVPFRRAFSDDPLNYSIPDQLPSLLIAAGGKPHRSQTRAVGQPIWTVGVDLNHRPERSHSILALTLVDPDGALVGVWTKEQPRDETTRSGALEGLLAQCIRRLQSMDSNPHVVILRDGRLFENEDNQVYEKVFRSNFSLFEYRKRGNPQIVQHARKPFAPLEPIAAIVPGLSTMFMTTAPPRDEWTLPRVTKVSWRKNWNRLNLEPRELASLLAASATAPGLGLHPRHLPAAIYWADGVAGAGDEDLRFRGVAVDRLNYKEKAGPADSKP